MADFATNDFADFAADDFADEADLGAVELLDAGFLTDCFFLTVGRDLAGLAGREVFFFAAILFLITVFLGFVAIRRSFRE